MSDFRGPLPLTDRDFAEVRRSVLTRVDRRPIALPIGLAAAAVLALVMLFVPTRPAPITKAPVVVHHPQPAPPPVQVAEKPRPVKAAPKPKRKPQPQLIASAGAPPSDSEITMNIETADPNVRIIWISR